MHHPLITILLCLLLLVDPPIVQATSATHWTYENVFGGPQWWGVLSPRQWGECAQGRWQSPVNIDPQLLLFDPRLGRVNLDKLEVEATLENTGQYAVIRLPQGDALNGNDAAQEDVRIPYLTGGPLGAYKYKLAEVVFHIGSVQGRQGSEHSVDGQHFAGEVQLMAYNDMYANYSEAMRRPHGVAAVAVMLDLSPASSSEMTKITRETTKIQFAGQKVRLSNFLPYFLLPQTVHYVTYEGSLTHPGCHETVVWIVMNKPIFVSETHLKMWNDLQRTAKMEPNAPQYLANNRRPLQPLNQRLLRTNINFKTKSSHCVYKDMYYRSNPERVRPRPTNDDRGIDYSKRRVEE